MRNSGMDSRQILTLPTLLALAFGALATPPLAAQGPLTPPGAPAPSLKSLAEIEPRIAVQSLAGDGLGQYVISQPGSYYLTGNITGVANKNAISIDADGVTLDFGGYALIGTGSSYAGIELRNNHTQIVVANGGIRNFPNGGVVANSNVTHSRFERLLIVGGGSGLNFVNGGGSNDGVVVRECTVAGGSGPYGIALSSARGTVERCNVSSISGPSGAVGISARHVSGCEVGDMTPSAGNATGISSAGQVSKCTVATITASAGSSAYGISSVNVADCEVTDITSGSGLCIGISATNVTGSSTANVSVGSGGSACFGITASNVAHCRVQSVARGSAIGITGNAVTGCLVSNVGSSGSIVTPVGISAATVSQCAVQSVGNAAASVGATGINGTAVSDSSVISIVGGTTGTSAGISAVSVQRCTVSAVSLAGGAGTSSGITAEEIIGCRLNTISSNGNGSAAGLSSYRLARDCGVNNVSCPNGFSYGAQTSNAGRSETLTVNLVTNFGISVTSAHVVANCVLSVCTVGIQATGTRNVIDGNNITGTSTTGISAVSGTNGANALIVRNQIRNCTTNIAADAPCQVGPVVLATGTIAGTNPWTNFTD